MVGIWPFMRPRWRKRLLPVLAMVCLALTMINLSAASAAAPKYAAIVINGDTGRVLHSRQADSRRYPASLTKIMTLYMVFERLRDGKMSLSTRLKVSRRAARQPPSKLGLAVGDTITVEQAIKALVTKSANDVAATVAENISGSELSFAKAMTRRARSLGMTRTNFRNASGLPNRRQISTARDMATLAIAIQRDFPRYYKYFKTRSFRFRGRVYRNHNRLLGRYEGTTGIKTGYIGASGFNLVASVNRSGRHLIGVVFGGRTGRSRDRQMVRLLDKGFKRLPVVMAAAKPPLPQPRPGAAVAAIAGPATAQTGSATPTMARVVASVDRPSAELGLWGIQVGAYSSATPATEIIQNARKKLPDLLGHTTISVEGVDRPHGRVFRARLVGLDERGAREACSQLRRQGLPCMPVPAPLKLALSS